MIKRGISLAVAFTMLGVPSAAEATVDSCLIKATRNGDILQLVVLYDAPVDVAVLDRLVYRTDWTVDWEGWDRLNPNKKFTSWYSAKADVREERPVESVMAIVTLRGDGSDKLVCKRTGL